MNKVAHWLDFFVIDFNLSLPSVLFKFLEKSQVESNKYCGSFLNVQNMALSVNKSIGNNVKISFTLDNLDWVLLKINKLLKFILKF